MSPSVPRVMTLQKLPGERIPGARGVIPSTRQAPRGRVEGHVDPPHRTEVARMPGKDQSENDDLKAKMREALDRKKGNHGRPAPGRGQGEGARLRGHRRRPEDAPPQGRRWRFVRFPTL